MAETIVDLRFWIGGFLAVFQAGLFAMAAFQNRNLMRSGQDPLIVRREQLRLAFGVAATASFIGGIMGAVTLLTMLDTDGGGLLPGLLAGVLIGAALATWNPWLRRLDVSEDLALAARTVALEHYPTWLPFVLAIPAASAIVYLLLVLGRDSSSMAAIGFATFGAMITMTLFSFSAISFIVLLRYSRTTDRSGRDMNSHV